MKRTLQLLIMTFAALVLLDVMVAFALKELKERGRVASLTNYFDLGRSVPTKIAEWRDNPTMPGNMLGVAWLDDIAQTSAEKFANNGEEQAPTIRNYGMSFSERVGRRVIGQDPRFRLDLHGGPAASANHSYAIFDADHQNRRAGDVVLFGVLSSSVPYLTTMSNRTWSFEQPSPFTYPKYELVNGTLAPIKPQVASQEDQEGLASSNALAQAWRAQLRQEDFFYSDLTFAAPWLDYSPFAKLVRRALVLRVLEDKRARVLSGEAYPIKAVLLEILKDVSEKAKADGQSPVIFLIQTGDRRDVNLRELLVQDLTDLGIPYVATEDFVDSSDPANFESDGHFSAEADEIFAAAVLSLVNAD